MQSAPALDPQMQADIDFVVREFSNHVRREEIKQQVMMRRGLSWNEAEEFVSFVETNYRRNIAARQTPLFLVLGIGSLIAGFLMLVYVIWRLQSGIPLNPLAMRSIIGSGVTGALLFVGGIIGLIQTLAALRK
jgi:hypothetical protein